MNYQTGTKFVSPTGEIYMLALVDTRKFALIGIKSGNRWSNPIIVEGIGRGLDSVNLLKLMNDADRYFYRNEVWPIDNPEPVSLSKVAASYSFPKEAAKKKPDTVTVVRYYRPLKDGTSDIDSSRGVTAIFDISYIRKSFTVRWSVCNGDNFDKRLGVELAKLNSKRFRGDYNKNVSLLDNLCNTLNKNPTEYDKNLVAMINEIVENNDE